jgi:sarcosine oxidase subunit beta
VRQQFSTEAEVRLAQASIAFFREFGAPFFFQVGYLFLATTDEGLARLRARAELQRGLGVPVEDVDASEVAGLRTDDVLGAVICREDGVANPPATARELVRRAAERGVDVREHTDAREVESDVLVVACGPRSPLLVPLPIRPLVRQLVDVGPVDGLPETLPMVVEEETTFHFRRRQSFLRLAMREPTARWSLDEVVDEALVDDVRARLASRYPSAAGAPVERAWAGLYDMTPDAHPIIGPLRDDVYVAAGFSGHGFMQSPAVGRAVAEELLELEPSFDLTPYRLERFAGDEVFPEELVL